MSSRNIFEGSGRFDGKRHQPITPTVGSWADQEAKRPRTPITPKQQAQRRAGLAHPEIANAVPLSGRRDDMDLPVGKGGLRRFATNAAGEGGGGPGSTAGILLGQAGYAAWARDMHERGNPVPAWDEGSPYNEEALSPAEVVDRLLERRDELSPGTRVKVAGGSGIDSDKIGVVVDRSEVKTDGRGIASNIQGHYKPTDWSREVAVKLDDGTLITMFKNRLVPVAESWAARQLIDKGPQQGR